MAPNRSLRGPSLTPPYPHSLVVSGARPKGPGGQPRNCKRTTPVRACARRARAAHSLRRSGLRGAHSRPYRRSRPDKGVAGHGFLVWGRLVRLRSWASGADRLAAAAWGRNPKPTHALEPTALGRLPHRLPGAGIRRGEALAPQCCGQAAGARDPRGDCQAPGNSLGARNPRSRCAVAGAVEASCGLGREGGAGGVVQVAGGGTVGGASGSRAPAGRLTVNVLPTPTWLLNATCPPWLLTMRSAIVSPRPVPGVVDSCSGTR